MDEDEELMGWVSKNKWRWSGASGSEGRVVRRDEWFGGASGSERAVVQSAQWIYSGRWIYSGHDDLLKQNKTPHVPCTRWIGAARHPSTLRSGHVCTMGVVGRRWMAGNWPGGAGRWPAVSRDLPLPINGPATGTYPSTASAHRRHLVDQWHGILSPFAVFAPSSRMASLCRHAALRPDTTPPSN